jgi:uncharacterized protein (TIGR03435 family)
MNRCALSPKSSQHPARLVYFGNLATCESRIIMPIRTESLFWVLLLASLVAVAPLRAQVVTMYHPAGPLPSYEVATIKPAPPSGARGRTTIEDYILDAYGTPSFSKSQVAGGPAWLTTDNYVIQGKVPDELRDAMQKMTTAEQTDQTRMMKQSLLADRFKLKVHFETRILPIYELSVTKGGLKIKSVAAPPPYVPGTPSPVIHSVGPGEPIPPGTWAIGATRPGVMFLSAGATTMGVLINFIRNSSDVAGKPVLDKTGFTANFDVPFLQWASLSTAPAPAAADTGVPDDPVPSIFTALEETLGLKLTPTKGPVEVLVIDSIDRPSEN